jgi:hypothetical protein
MQVYLPVLSPEGVPGAFLPDEKMVPCQAAPCTVCGTLFQIVELKKDSLFFPSPYPPREGDVPKMSCHELIVRHTMER